MRLLRTFRNRFIAFLFVCSAVMFVTYLSTILAVPDEITLIEGQEYYHHFRSPLFVNIRADQDGIVKVSNGTSKGLDGVAQITNPVSLTTQSRGSVMLELKLFGIIPLRTMKVDVIPNNEIVACGNTIGVKMKTEGILVIGLSDVDTIDGKKALPARDSGIKTGDLLLEANKTKLQNIDDLVNEINRSNGKEVALKCKRDDEIFQVLVTPVKALDDKKYHIGLWVRNSTAGIGTLTFYMPGTRYFGALGHGITDIDTSALMPIEAGEILECNILGIKKGEKGNPGELKGVFAEDRKTLGKIMDNTSFGIYGRLSADALAKVSYKTYPIGLRSQVKEGPATIISNIDGTHVEEYSIDIQKVSKQSLNGSKGMVILITDERLLNETGGIVQGMSGSPIIQDNRIIGAVTHVLVNDPTRGYGIFIEGMLKNIPASDKQKLEKAG